MTIATSIFQRTTLEAILRRPVFREMVKFMSVGVVNVALSLLIVHIAVDRLRATLPEANTRLVAANTIAFAITVTTAFVLNARFTFQSRGAGRDAYFKYAVVNIVGFGINTALVLAFTHLIALLLGVTAVDVVDHHKIVWSVGYLGAVGCAFFWNFFISRLWVFPSRTRQPRQS